MADFAKLASKEIEKELKEALKAFEKLGDEFTKKERKKLLRPAANVLKREISSNAPKSKTKHYRYATAKFNQSIKAPKGQGNKVATYYPGNLARAIKVLSFRKSSDLFVGPRLSKRNKSGEFKGGRVDGFYARFIEFGTKHFAARPFIRPAVATAKNQVIIAIRNSTKKKVKEFANKYRK